MYDLITNSVLVLYQGQDGLKNENKYMYEFKIRNKKAFMFELKESVIAKKHKC